MYQGFETRDPRRLVMAQAVGLLSAWVVVIGFVVALFVQALYESSQAAIVYGVLILLLVAGPLWQISRKRVGVDPIATDDEDSDVSRDLVYRG